MRNCQELAKTVALFSTIVSKMIKNKELIKNYKNHTRIIVNLVKREQVVFCVYSGVKSRTILNLITIHNKKAWKIQINFI